MTLPLVVEKTTSYFAIGTRVQRPKARLSAYWVYAGWAAPNPIGTIIPFKGGASTWTFEGRVYQLVRWDRPNFLDVQPVPVDVLYAVAEVTR